MNTKGVCALKGLLLTILGICFFSVEADAEAEAQKELCRWSFGAADQTAVKGWMADFNCCKSVRLERGLLVGEVSGADPFIMSPSFTVKATPTQTIVFRAKTDMAGTGEVFWIPTTTNGPRQAWSEQFKWNGDKQWHKYAVRPFWQGLGDIQRIRIDFPNHSKDGSTFEFTDISVIENATELGTNYTEWRDDELEQWKAVDETLAVFGVGMWIAKISADGGIESPALRIPSTRWNYTQVEISADSSGSCRMEWAVDNAPGKKSKTFKVRGDGRFHAYGVDMDAKPLLRQRLAWLRITPVSGEGQMRFKDVQFSDDFNSPADILLESAKMADALNRVGDQVPICIQIRNIGGSSTTNASISIAGLPEGVHIVSPEGWQRLPEIPEQVLSSVTILLQADRPVTGDFVLTLNDKVRAKNVFKDAERGQLRVKLEITASRGLPRASYVPEPKPLNTAPYEIGALYFPGWAKAEAWARIAQSAPERKPVLGWYDEGNPEAVDWQIKWEAENGISFLLVDWYWSAGQQHLDHWVKAFQQAKYRKYMRWAMMWANHNAAGSHSEADQRAVTKFWLDNYFNTPEYYRIDDKPVVMIWSPANMDRDVQPDGCKRLLEISRNMAKDAGYKGIYFIAMKWPEDDCSANVVQKCKDWGFDCTSIYHYMGNGGKATNPASFSYELVADSNCGHWDRLRKTGILPFLPNISTGWDSRPWHGDKATVIHGKSIALFDRICHDAKRFADESGVKRLLLAPLNEWGEGSYAEPNTEFGFGFYETLRETFCEKPAEGWPLNYGPKDVGLGPYDLPLPTAEPETREWAFTNTAAGWSMLMGIKSSVPGPEGLALTTANADPAISRSFHPLRAKSITDAIVTMKVSPGKTGSCQLFWGASNAEVSEENSLSEPLIRDNAFHDYRFRLAGQAGWRGSVNQLRFDPCSEADTACVIKSIRFLPTTGR